MSDQPARNKGIRTFASDFARVKGAGANKETSPALVVPPTTPLTPAPTTKQESGVVKIKPNSQHTDQPSLRTAVRDIDLSKTKSLKKAKTVHSRPNKSVGGGAIITDTKKNSFSLFEASRQAVNDWWKEKNKKSSPKFAIPEAERRKGVIKQATTKSGTIFTADSETLRERIKERNRLAINRPNEPETSWSPYTETGYDLLPAESEVITTAPPMERIKVEYKQRSTPIEQVAEPVVEELAVEESVPTRPIVDTPEAIVSAPIVDTPKEVASTPSQTDVPALSSSRSPVNLSTNKLTFYISAGIALVCVTAFFVWIVMANQGDAVPVSTTVEEVNQERYLADTTFSISQFQAYSTDQPYTEIVLVNELDEPLSSAQVFEVVIPLLPVEIRQYTSEVRFIQYDNVPPQLVITVSDAASVTGSLLTHEAPLALSLEPLFGLTPDTGTYFDQTIGDTDVRVLRGSSVTYGIVNNTYLIIAVSPDAFTQVINLIQD